MTLNGMRIGISGMGYYLPTSVIKNSDFEKFLDTSDEWITSRTGIKQRYIAASDQASSDLGIEAAKRALDHAGLQPGDIDLVIAATATPDMVFPATACIIQAGIGATQAGAFDLSSVCSGFIFALVTAYNYIRAGNTKHVLVVGTEKFSSVLDWQDRSTCVLMGDGAGAFVVSRDAEHGTLLASILGTDPSGIENLLIPAGGSKQPASHATVDARAHFMKMNGQEIFKFGTRIIGECLEATLAKAGLKPEQLDLFIPHQANARIIYAAAKKINLPPEKVVINIDQVSNTSAASIPIAMVQAFEQNKIQSGMHIALVAFGAGLSWGTVVLRW